MEPVKFGFSPTYWHVVFMPRKRQKWHHWLSPHWCRHVLCYAYSAEAKSYVIINPTDKLHCVHVVSEAYFPETINHLIGEEYTRLLVKAQEGTYLANRFLQTCSSVVSRIVGINKSGLTPYRLFLSLIHI